MGIKLIHTLLAAALLFFAPGAPAGTVCGQVIDDQPEIASNLDELRRFTITDKRGDTHTVLTEIDPDLIRGAPLRAIREAMQSRMDICVSGNEILDSETKQLMALTVERALPAKTTLEAPIALAPGDSNTK